MIYERAAHIPPPSMVDDPLFDIHSSEWLYRKAEHYDHLRRMDRAYWSERYGFWVFTRYNDVSYILDNDEIFSSARGNLPIEGSSIRFGRSLGASDNPQHTYLQRIVRRSYGREASERVGESFRNYLEERLRGIREIDISELCLLSAAHATSEIVNFPTGISEFRDRIIEKQQSEYGRDNAPILVSDDLIREIIGRRETSGGIYRDCIEAGAEVPETLSLILSAVISGAASLASALQHLTIHIEGYVEVLRSRPELRRSSIEESIRLSSSTGRFARTVTRPVSLHGIDLSPGDRVLASIEGANLDPNQFINPLQYIIDRSPNRHLGWGRGVHKCIALGVSERLMRIYLDQLIDFGPYEIVSVGPYHITEERNIDRIKSIIVRKK